MLYIAEITDSGWRTVPTVVHAQIDVKFRATVGRKKIPETSRDPDKILNFGDSCTTLFADHDQIWRGPTE